MTEMWQLKGAYLSQTSTVNKLLREGWEPFWGYRCTNIAKNKPDVKMYFRQAPVVELQAVLEAGPSMVQIDPVSLESLSNIINELNFKFDEVIEKFLNNNTPTLKPAFTISKSLLPDLTTEEVEADRQEMEERESQPQEPQERAAPRGEEFRVVDDIPPELVVRHRTDVQDKVIDEIRRTADTNITISAPDPDGNVSVLVGDAIIEIEPSGNTSTRKNTANRTSLI